MLLIDENLSYRLEERLQPDFPGTCSVSRIDDLGEGTADEKVWAYAKNHHLAILTKDKDFVAYWRQFGPPPKVIRLDIGNCRLAALEQHVRYHHAQIIRFLQTPNTGLLII